MILHDRQFNVAGLNALVNYWFDIEISKLKDQNINVQKVRKITIIDIDTLILYQENLKQGDIKLNEIIDEYFNFVTVNPKKKFRSQEEAEEHGTRRLIPFQLFLWNKTMKEHLKRKPNILFEKAGLLFENEHE